MSETILNNTDLPCQLVFTCNVVFTSVFANIESGLPAVSLQTRKEKNNNGSLSSGWFCQLVPLGIVQRTLSFYYSVELHCTEPALMRSPFQLVVSH